MAHKFNFHFVEHDTDIWYCHSREELIHELKIANELLYKLTHEFHGNSEEELKVYKDAKEFYIRNEWANEVE